MNAMYNEIRITDLTINCWVLFILDSMVKQNDGLSKVKDKIEAKEGEYKKITGKYISVMENWLSVFSKLDLIAKYKSVFYHLIKDSLSGN